jgi:hypothetical protein
VCSRSARAEEEVGKKGRQAQVSVMARPWSERNWLFGKRFCPFSPKAQVFPIFLSESAAIYIIKVLMPHRVTVSGRR